MAKCPYCNSIISSLTLEEITSSAFMGQPWRTLAYVCPHCQKILNVTIDPIAIKTDTIRETIEIMRTNRTL
jgi:uncharacterized protein with PIN domain